MAVQEYGRSNSSRTEAVTECFWANVSNSGVWLVETSKHWEGVVLFIDVALSWVLTNCHLSFQASEVLDM